jgi:hypothetical protein
MDRFSLSTQGRWPWAETVSETEQVVVWAFRQWISGHAQGRGSHWSIAWRHLSDLCGSADGTRAVTALEGMVRAICLNAIRPIGYHQPHCPCIGEDERSLIELLAACQRRQWLNAASHAKHLVGDDGAGSLIASAARLAALLGEHGHHLPVCGPPPAPTRVTALGPSLPVSGPH